MTREELIVALQAIAQESWSAHQSPTLLSHLPKVLEQRLQSNYKLVLGAESLKGFIKASQAAGMYRLVEHPTQRAKLGIVPAGVDFEFLPEKVNQVTDALSKNDIEGFMRVLNSLTSDELRGLSLPAVLVVKLLETK